MPTGTRKARALCRVEPADTGAPAGDDADPSGAPSGFADTSSTGSVSALSGRTTPKPYCGSRPGGPRSFAVLIICWITLGALSLGYLARISAAKPETNAAAGLVPVALA